MNNTVIILRFFYRLLLAAVLGLAAAAALRIGIIVRDNKSPVSAVVTSAASPAFFAATAKTPSADPPEMAVFSRRDIFSPPGEDRPEETAPAGAAIPGFDFPSWQNGYHIRAIAVDDQPLAVVEDSQTGKKYFLGRGDSLDSAVVKDIQTGKILIEVNQKVFEWIFNNGG